MAFETPSRLGELAGKPYTTDFSMLEIRSGSAKRRCHGFQEQPFGDCPMYSLSNRFVRRPVLYAIVAILGANTASASAGPIEEANKKIVIDFYTMSFRDHKPKQAADLYIGDTYIQHNPNVPNGPEPFYGFFEGYFRKNPDASNEIKRVIAEGDLVVLHSHSKITPDVAGNAIVDIFRIEDGKIVEHWDVMQPVPSEPSPNGNTMFEGSNAD